MAFDIYTTDKYEILTTDGWKSFEGISTTYSNTIQRIYFSETETFECTPDHLIWEDAQGWTAANLLQPGDICSGKQIKRTKQISEFTKVYDILNVADMQSFISSGLNVHNCILLDEFAHIPRNIQEEFFRSTYPVISSGQSTKVIVITTPNGMELFYKMWQDASEDPPRNEYIPFRAYWYDVPWRDEKWKQETIRNIGQTAWNQEFECDFLGSSNSLISSSKLAALTYKNPKFQTDDGIKVYEIPQQGHIYALIADCSHGRGLDYSTFTIFDITEMPYKQVLTFRNNTVTPLLFPSIIHRYATEYNGAYTLIEVNDIGAQVASILHQDLEYENMILVTPRGAAGQEIGGGFTKNIQFGVKTTKAVKRIGCSAFKMLVEEDKLLLCDFDTIQEISTFAERNGSYSAEEGCHDDLVMNGILLGWLTTRKYFTDLIDQDLREQMYANQMKEIEEEVLPFGFISDGRDEHIFKDNEGNRWTSTSF